MTRTALLLGIALLALSAATANAQAPTARTTLDIYVIDVEGGNATLFVPPSGQSVLMDTGNVAPEAAKRDAARIMLAVKDAGLTQIDHLITTHWHGDHFGGMAELAAQIPIRHYIDHGDSVQPQPANTEFLANVYPGLVAKARRTIVKPAQYGLACPAPRRDEVIVCLPEATICQSRPATWTVSPGFAIVRRAFATRPG